MAHIAPPRARFQVEPQLRQLLPKFLRDHDNGANWVTVTQLAEDQGVAETGPSGARIAAPTTNTATSKTVLEVTEEQGVTLPTANARMNLAEKLKPKKAPIVQKLNK